MNVSVRSSPPRSSTEVTRPLERSRGNELAGHAEMYTKSSAVMEPKEKILASAVDRVDPATQQLLAKPVRSREERAATRGSGDLGNRPPDH
jgi:hypothetical protein